MGKSNIFLKKILTVFLILVSIRLIIFLCYLASFFITSYQDANIRQIYYREKIENMLFLYRKEVHITPWPYDICLYRNDVNNLFKIDTTIRCTNATDYYWITYSIIGIHPIDVVYDKNNKKINQVSTYE